jgi:hypothetical protein
LTVEVKDQGVTEATATHYGGAQCFTKRNEGG